MLAPILVDTHLDTSGGGSTSLRDAIIQAEASSAPDEITFAPSVDGESILLTQGALPTITHSLSIDTQGQDITVDASGNGGGSVFVINTDVPFGALPDLDYIIAGLTITGGDASHGGGIYFRGISGNFFPSANPEDYRDVTLTIRDTVIRDNHAENSGGGVHLDIDSLFGGVAVVDIVRSTIKDNQMLAGPASGGGIYAVLNNDGGALPLSRLNLTDSTISGNVVEEGNGGGIVIFQGADGGQANITNTTVSGNFAGNGAASNSGVFGRGGGLWVGIAGTGLGSTPNFSVELNNVTVTDNTAHSGGGLYKFGLSSETARTTLNHSIVSENLDLLGADDNIYGPINATGSNYNLTGTGEQPTGTGNITNENDPGLAALANNGGPTETHLPLAGSQAINNGDPLFDKNDPDGDPSTDDEVLNDQRGAPYDRVFGVIDIGAVEVQTVAPHVANVIFSRPGGNNPPSLSMDTRDGGGAQLQNIGVAETNTVIIEFDSPVSIQKDDLTIVSLRGGVTPDFLSGVPGFSVAPDNLSATWTLEAGLSSNQYALRLSDDVTGLTSGAALDGEWDNPTSSIVSSSNTGQLFPSGDTIAGGEFQFAFTFLAADFDLSNIVDLLDLDALGTNFGGTSVDFGQGDANGDGVVDLLDLDALGTEWAWDLTDLILAADYDGDLDVDLADFSAFFSLFGAGDLAVDLNGDGILSELDQDVFLTFLGLDLAS